MSPAHGDSAKSSQSNVGVQSVTEPPDGLRVTETPSPPSHAWILAISAILLGAGYCLGFAPFNLWPATFVALGLFYLLMLRGARPMLLAWLFGVGKYAVGVSWVYVSIHEHGNASPVLAASLVAIFVAGMALFCLPVGWLMSRLRVGAEARLANAVLFCVAVAITDWLLTWFLTGFPWLLPGYAFMETMMIGWGPVVGVLGLGLLALTSAVATVHLAIACVGRIQRQDSIQLRSLSWPIGVTLAPWLIGLLLLSVDWTTPVASHQVALVQGNLEQRTKWLPENRETNVRKHVELSAAHWDSDLIVWPEASVTMFARSAQNVLNQLQSQGEASATNVVLGIPGLREVPGTDALAFQNLAVGLGLAGGRFAKHHLVPFGEYVPLESVLRGMIEFFDLPMSHSAPGPALQDNIHLSFGEAAMAICYEVAYPDTMRRHARSAALLMTISNDTWFGSSIGPDQHLQIAQMRAIENGRWLVRATNNGLTAIVDPKGVVIDRLPQFRAGVLRGSVDSMQGRTPFNMVGHWPFLLVILAGFVFVFRRRF